MTDHLKAQHEVLIGHAAVLEALLADPTTPDESRTILVPALDRVWRFLEDVGTADMDTVEALVAEAREVLA